MTLSNWRRHRLGCCLIGLSATLSGAQAQNVLSPAESEAGYDLLFNGSDLENWHSHRLDSVIGGWAAKADAPLGPRIENLSGSQYAILTDRTYRNFDLKFDVQVPSANSGWISVRYEETYAGVLTFTSGPALFICGPNTSECNIRNKAFGACYDMFAVKESLWKTWYNPPGAWNQVRIVAFDSNIVHYGNGKKLLEYKLGTQEFMDAYNVSRYVIDGNNGRYYDIHPGGIMLAPHYGIGNSFRNLKAKALSIHPFLREFPDGRWPDSLPQDFVFGDPAVALTPRGRFAAPGFSSRPGKPGETLVAFPSPPSDLRAAGLDGRAVVVREMGPGLFALAHRQAAPEAVVLRYRSGTEPKAGVLLLH